LREKLDQLWVISKGNLIVYHNGVHFLIYQAGRFNSPLDRDYWQEFSYFFKIPVYISKSYPQKNIGVHLSLLKKYNGDKKAS